MQLILQLFFSGWLHTSFRTLRLKEINANKNDSLDVTYSIRKKKNLFRPAFGISTKLSLNSGEDRLYYIPMVSTHQFDSNTRKVCFELMASKYILIGMEEVKVKI